MKERSLAPPLSLSFPAGRQRQQRWFLFFCMKRPAGLPHLIVRNMFESVQEDKLFKKEVAAARAAMLKAKRDAPEAGPG